MISKLINWLKWLYWSGKYTKVKLWKAEEIGVDEGYFECSSEHHDIIMQYYSDLKVMDYREAGRLLDQRHKTMMRKYFGPKYIKA